MRVALILILLLISNSEDKKDKDWMIDNLKGQVKIYTEISYYAINRSGKIEK